MTSVQDPPTLEKLWLEYSPRLLAMLERRIGDNQRRRYGPEDVLNETFLRAQRKWAKYQEDGKMTPWAWLYRLAFDALSERWQSDHRGPRALCREMPLPDRSSVLLGLKILSPATKPSEAFVRQELRDRVHQVMKLLTDKQRQVLEMRYFDGFSTAEIASVLGQEKDAVHQHHSRAMKKLTKHWQALNPEGGQP
jgi:RNA polymerase sigma-70 factor, ECF subfamily